MVSRHLRKRHSTMNPLWRLDDAVSVERLGRSVGSQWMKNLKWLTLLLALHAGGCVTTPQPPAEWGHKEHLPDADAGSPWALYSDETLLRGQHTHVLCATSNETETKNARFCFRRVQDQLVIYVVPSHEQVRTARAGAGILTYVRVDRNPSISPRSALGQGWGRGFNPRFPDASFPVDGTNPRSGIVEPGGLVDQLLKGETLSALVPLRPDRFGDYAVHLDGFATLFNKLWEHEE